MLDYEGDGVGDSKQRAKYDIALHNGVFNVVIHKFYRSNTDTKSLAARMQPWYLPRPSGSMLAICLALIALQVMIRKASITSNGN
jgi:hypothetical protein